MSKYILRHDEPNCIGCKSRMAACPWGTPQWDPATRKVAKCDYCMDRLHAGLYRSARLPVFDLVLLGMGDNGHTASLFPGTAVLRETARWVVAQYVEVMSTWRVTYTAPLINAARHVAFLAEGSGKAQMLWNVLEGPYQPDVWPSQLIQPVSGELHWLVDAAVAASVGATAA